MDYTISFDIFWLIAYTVGTLFGYIVARTMPRDDVIEATINYMIENNLVRWKRDENGEIELLDVDSK